MHTVRSTDCNALFKSCLQCIRDKKLPVLSGGILQQRVYYVVNSLRDKWYFLGTTHFTVDVKSCFWWIAVMERSQK